jgi:hypothetical protein
MYVFAWPQPATEEIGVFAGSNPGTTSIRLKLFCLTMFRLKPQNDILSKDVSSTDQFVYRPVRPTWLVILGLFDLT